MQNEIERLRGKYKALQNQTDAISIVSGMEKVKAVTAGAIKQIVAMGAAYLSVKNAIATVINAQNELNNKGRDVGIRFDEAFRKFSTQSGWEGPKLDQAQSRIQEIAVSRAMDPVEVAGIAEQLVSSGFTPEEASGKSLDETLKLMIATNQAMSARGDGAVSTKDLVQAMTAMLETQGIPKTAEGVSKFATPAQSAFKSTNLQLEDFLAFAPESAVTRGILSLEQAIAMFSKIRDTNPSGPESATSIRNIVLRTTAIKEPTRLAELDQLGITKEQIDGIGEDWLEGMKVLRAAIGQKSKEEQRRIANVMFEERGIAPFLTIMEPGVIEDIQKRSTKFADVEQFNKDVQIASSGKAAQARRIQAQEDIRIGTKSQKISSPQEVVKAAQNIAAGSGMSDLEASVRGQMSSFLIPLGQVAGVSPETTTSTIFGPGPAARTNTEFRQRLQRELNPVAPIKMEPRRQLGATRTPEQLMDMLGRIGGELKTDSDQSLSQSDAESYVARIGSITSNEGMKLADSKLTQRMEVLDRSLRDLIATMQSNSKATSGNTKELQKTSKEPSTQPLTAKKRSQPTVADKQNARVNNR